MSVSLPQRPPSNGAGPVLNVATGGSGSQQHAAVAPAAIVPCRSITQQQLAEQQPTLPPPRSNSAESLAVDAASSACQLPPLLSSQTTDSRTKLDLVIKLIDYTKQCSLASVDLIAAMGHNHALALFKSLRLLLTLDKDPTLRAQSLRALRYVLSTAPSPSLSLFYSLNIDLFLIRSLERESKYLWERLQAFKLFKRLFLLLPKSLTRAIIQSILAIAEQPKDDFRRVSLDAMREMMLSIPEQVCSCNGVRVLIDAILDPANSDVAGNLTLTLLFVLDQDSTRRFLRPSVDIIRLCSVFTDTQASDSPDRESRRLAAHRCLVTMMRSWPGILCLTSDHNALHSLIQVLTLPSSVKGSSWAREAVFDLILEILQVVKSVDLRSINHRGRLSVSTGHGSHGNHSSNGSNLLHCYIVTVLLAFIDCGLVDTLTQLASSNDTEFRSVSTKLLIEILSLSADLLPPSLTATLNSLPTVVRQSAQFDSKDVSHRVRALQLVTTLSSDQPSMTINDSGNVSSDGWYPPSWSHDSPLKPRFGLGSAHDLYSSSSALAARMTQHGIRLDRYMSVTSFNHSHHYHSQSSASLSLSSITSPSQSSPFASTNRHAVDQLIDSQELDALIKRTQIPYTKDYRVWDLPLILQLLEGPLQSPTHLVSVISRTKFIKRLCSFLRPEKQLFSGLDFIPPHLIFVQIAVSMVKIMIACQEGRDYPYFLQFVDNIFELILSEISRGSDSRQSMSSQSAHGGSGASSGIATPHSSILRRNSANDDFDISSSHQSVVTGLADALNAAKSISASAQAHTRKLTRMVKGKTKSNYRCLSRINAPRKLSQSYFLLIGILSSTRFGLAFFDKYGLYDHLYRLGSDSSKDYLTRMFLIHFDYSERTARTLLETWVKSGSLTLRKFVVSFLRGQMRSKSQSDFSWAIGMMAAQLQHNDAALKAAVIALLEEAVQDPVCLTTLIKKKPIFAQCGPLSAPLQLSFLASTAGLEYLQSINALQPTMTLWKHDGAQKYVESLEGSLVAALSDELETKHEQSSTNSNATNHRTTDGATKTDDASKTSTGNRGNSLQVDRGLAQATHQTQSQIGVAATQQTPPGTRSPSPVPTQSQPSGLPPLPSTPPSASLQPPSAASAPFFFSSPSMRSASDDYFLARLHDLPWTVEVTAEWSGGRTVQIPCDAYVFSSPYEINEKNIVNSTPKDANSDGDGTQSPATAPSPHCYPLQVYLLCTMLDSNGVPTPYRVDPHCTLRARISCGGGQSERFGSSQPSSSLNSPSPSTNHRSMPSPFRATPSSSPRASSQHGHSPSPFSSHIQLPYLSELGDPRRAFDESLINWHSNYFTFPMCEQVCRPQTRNRANLVHGLSLAQSFASAQSVPVSNSRGFLWTSTKDEDRAKWQFTLALSSMPPTPRRERDRTLGDRNGESASLPPPAPSAPMMDFLLESIAFPITLPSSHVPAVFLAKHFYGELARTSEGCVLLKQSGHISEFVRAIKHDEIEWHEALNRKVLIADRRVTSSPRTTARMTNTLNSLTMSATLSNTQLPQQPPTLSLASSGNASPTQSPRPATLQNPNASLLAHSMSTSFSSPSSSANLSKRASLWAIGHIASSNTGFALLSEYNIIPFISDAALHHPTLSFRGTCFYILSLMSRSQRGRRALEELGWETPANSSLGVIVPKVQPRFLTVQSTSFAGSWPQDRRNVFGIPAKKNSTTESSVVLTTMRPYSDGELEILTHLSNLCNYVTQRQSLQSLRAMKSSSTTGPLFQSPLLLFDTFRVMTTYTFRLPARRFLLFDLFASVQFSEANMAAFDAPFLPPMQSQSSGGTVRELSLSQSSTPRLLSPPSGNSGRRIDDHSGTLKRDRSANEIVVLNEQRAKDRGDIVNGSESEAVERRDRSLSTPSRSTDGEVHRDEAPIASRRTGVLRERRSATIHKMNP